MKISKKEKNLKLEKFIKIEIKETLKGQKWCRK